MSNVAGCLSDPRQCTCAVKPHLGDCKDYREEGDHIGAGARTCCHEAGAALCRLSCFARVPLLLEGLKLLLHLHDLVYLRCKSCLSC